MSTLTRTSARQPLSSPRPRRSALAAGGLLAVSLTFVLIASLDLIKASTSPDLLRYTISEYGLGPQRAPFTAAVLLLAAGSLTTLGVLIRQGTTRLRSGASAALVLWALGLSVIAIFPKRDRSAVADTISGEIHRIASLVAPPVR